MVCSQCNQRHRAFSTEKMADLIETALDIHFRLTPDAPSALDYALGRDWLPDNGPIADVIESMAEINAAAAEEVRKVLEDRHFDYEAAKMGEQNPFGKQAHYTERSISDNDLRTVWETFENDLKTQTRYFSRSAQETLASIFDGIENHHTGQGTPVIVGGPGTELTALYRARVFQRDGELEEAIKRPEKGIGPPPPALAIAGRMNAHGISVFYGATGVDVALAEVSRPPVGSKVVTGRFDVIRPVLLLDLDALKDIRVAGSVFDEDYAARLQKAKFLEGLSSRLSKAVMPTHEPLEYLATQALADYLATEANPVFDGMIYPSVQAGEGKNVVLFHRSACVEPISIPDGTEISSHLYSRFDRGEEIDCSVVEEVPVESPSDASDSRFLTELFGSSEGDDETRTPVLRLDTTSFTVALVESVKFDVTRFPVHRHRWTKPKQSQEIDKQDYSGFL